MALINYTGKNIFGVFLPSGEPVKLLPGINEVEDEKLQAMKKYPLFQSRVEQGLIIIMMENLAKDGKRTIEEMLSHIPKIFDIKLLKKLIESDGRDKVVHAAREQLDKIKNPAKAKAQEQDEHFS